VGGPTLIIIQAKTPMEETTQSKRKKMKRMKLERLSIILVYL